MSYSKEVVDQVWEKGRATGNRDSNEWRKDECGAWIRYNQYGSEESGFGWKILNVSAGGVTEPEGLRPFHVENDFNRNTGRVVCRIKADREGLPSTARVGAPRNMPA